MNLAFRFLVDPQALSLLLQCAVENPPGGLKTSDFMKKLGAGKGGCRGSYCCNIALLHRHPSSRSVPDPLFFLSSEEETS
jgi:hypothetical protein